MKIRVALAGNPNVGKTVIFNALTGSKQYVGNWPGVTVEKKVGKFNYKDAEIEVVDLPGTYSLSPYSIDEKIARDYILEERPDVVVQVVDASNLERNLYLTIQLLEARANLVVALNMMDDAEARGMKIDVKKLSEILKVPVVPMIAVNGVGFDELKEAIYKRAGMREEGCNIEYGEAEKYIESLQKEIEKYPELKKHSRWLAIKLLEGEQDVLSIKLAGGE